MLLTHSSMDGLSVDYCLAGFYCARTGWAAGCRFSLGVLHIFPELGLEEWLLPKVCSSHLDSRSRTAGQKHCSERAVHFAHIPWRSHGMQCRPHGQAHSHGAERHGWKRGEGILLENNRTITPWQQHQMLEGSRVLSGLGYHSVFLVQFLISIFKPVL